MKELSDIEYIRMRSFMFVGSVKTNSLEYWSNYYFLMTCIIECSRIFQQKYQCNTDILFDSAENSITLTSSAYCIPHEYLLDYSTKLEQDGESFQEHWFITALNALSSYFVIKSCNNGKERQLTFEKGELKDDISSENQDMYELSIHFVPDKKLFPTFQLKEELLEDWANQYAYLCPGHTITLNGKDICHTEGMKNFIDNNRGFKPYEHPTIRLYNSKIDIAFNYYLWSEQENYYSFVNDGQTFKGGTHLEATKKYLATTICKRYGIENNSKRVLYRITLAVNVKIFKPVYESATKINLVSEEIQTSDRWPITKEEKEELSYISIDSYVKEFISTELNRYLDEHPETDKILRARFKY